MASAPAKVKVSQTVRKLGPFHPLAFGVPARVSQVLVSVPQCSITVSLRRRIH